MSATLAGAAFAEAIEAALARAGKGAAITEAAANATRDVVRAAQALAVKRGVDVRDLLIGDETHDRAVLNAAALNGEIQSAVNWMTVPAAALTIAFQVVQAAARIAVLL